MFCMEDTPASALLEVRRVAEGTLNVTTVSAEAFEKQLVSSYQRDSDEARQMMAEIGNEMDFIPSQGSCLTVRTYWMRMTMRQLSA